MLLRGASNHTEFAKKRYKLKGLARTSLCYRQNKTPVMSVCKTAQKSLFWASSCVPGFEYVPWLACSKTISSICRSGWRKIRKVFLVAVFFPLNFSPKISRIFSSMVCILEIQQFPGIFSGKFLYHLPLSPNIQKFWLNVKHSVSPMQAMPELIHQQRHKQAKLWFEQ